MAMARHLLRHPEIAHGPIRVCFTRTRRSAAASTPICRKSSAPRSPTRWTAPRRRDRRRDVLGRQAVVTIDGRAIHPGMARDDGQRVRLAAKFLRRLPRASLTPETTEGREGFIHLSRRGRHRRGRAALHPARLRATPGLAAQGDLLHGIARLVGRSRAARDVTASHAAVPQHALLAEKRHAPGRAGAREACRRSGIEPIDGIDPRRHRRLTGFLPTASLQMRETARWISSSRASSSSSSALGASSSRPISASSVPSRPSRIFGLSAGRSPRPRRRRPGGRARR